MWKCEEFFNSVIRALEAKGFKFDEKTVEPYRVRIFGWSKSSGTSVKLFIYNALGPWQDKDRSNKYINYFGYEINFYNSVPLELSLAGMRDILPDKVNWTIMEDQIDQYNPFEIAKEIADKVKRQEVAFAEQIEYYTGKLTLGEIVRTLKRTCKNFCRQVEKVFNI